MHGREMFRQMTNDKQTSRLKVGNRKNRWSKVQADAVRRFQNSTKEILKIGRRKVHVFSNKPN